MAQTLVIDRDTGIIRGVDRAPAPNERTATVDEEYDGLVDTDRIPSPVETVASVTLGGESTSGFAEGPPTQDSLRADLRTTALDTAPLVLAQFVDDADLRTTNWLQRLDMLGRAIAVASNIDNDEVAELLRDEVRVSARDFYVNHHPQAWSQAPIASVFFAFDPAQNLTVRPEGRVTLASSFDGIF